MSARAVATGSINLGQGFPDRDGPASVARAAADAILAGRGNQYPPGPGIPELRQAIAAHDERFYRLCHDPADEVLVTAGATEAVAAAMLALVEPAKAVTGKTRLILLNSPHNPTGSVFSRDELAAIARLAVERDLLVVTDEVYEHLVFDGEHVPIAGFPGMRERTV